MRASGRVVPRDSLIEEVWGDRDVTYNNLEVFIRFLRAKVDRDGRARSSTPSAESATAFGVPSAERPLPEVPAGRVVLLHGGGHLCAGRRRLLVRHSLRVESRAGSGTALPPDRAARSFSRMSSPGGQRDRLPGSNEISQLGELYQVFDGDGSVDRAVARAGAPRRAGGRPPRDLGSEIRYGTGGTPDFPLRLAWQKVTIAGQPLILGAADPQRKFEGVLSAFTSGPPAVDAAHPGAGDALRPVARPARPRTRRPDHRRCARHHRAEPVRAAGGAGFTGRAAATLGNAERDARADRAVVHADEAIHGGCVPRAAGADDVDLHGSPVLAASRAEPGGVGGRACRRSCASRSGRRR